MEVNLPFLLCFTLYLGAMFQVQAPEGDYIWTGDLTEGFLRYRFGGLYLEEPIHVQKEGKDAVLTGADCNKAAPLEKDQC